MAFFEVDFCGNLRALVNATNVFYMNDQEKTLWNMLCAMMDRVDESTKSLNRYENCPKNIDDFMLFMMHSCIIKDATKKVLEAVGINYYKISCSLPRCFWDVCKGQPFNLSDDEIPTDDKFFEYIRSLVFAHPLETSRSIVAKRGMNEVHYAAGVILDDFYSGQKDSVSILVYSNVRKESLKIVIKFELLKQYIRYQYGILEKVLQRYEKQKNEFENSFKKLKVDRTGSVVDILLDIKRIENLRYHETGEIDDLISLMSVKPDTDKNQNSLSQVQCKFEEILNNFCDAIDGMDYELSYQILQNILYKHPKRMHEGAHYELEKIFSYLHEDAYWTDQIWGKQMAANFAKGFASKWVDIDVNKMSFDEIKVLTTVACYLEAQEQEREANDRKN